jgi:hypothetical protein
LKEQGPHTLEKSIEDKLASVKKVGDKIISSQANKQAKRKRAELYADLEGMLNKYSKIVE